MQVLQQWQADWAKYIAVAGLAPDIGAAGAAAALTILTDIEGACATLLELQESRIRPMQTTVESFRVDAENYTATCLPGAPPLPPAEAAARLSKALTAAQTAETDYMRITMALNKITTGETKAAADGSKAMAQVVPMLAAPKVADIDALRLAIIHPDACRSAERRVSEATTAASTSGDGLPLEWLAKEVDAEDPALLAQRIAEAIDARDMAATQRDECIGRRTEAELAFNKIAGGDDAAKAEAQRQDALLIMGDAVDEYRGA